MRRASPLAIWAALLAVYVIWGSTYLAIRFAVATIPPFLMAGLRFLIAGSVLYAVRRLLGDPHPARAQWRGAGLAGLLLLTLGNGGVVWSEQRGLPSSTVAVIIATTPLWFVLLDWLRPGGVQPSWRILVSVLVGFAGVVLLVGPWSQGGVRALDPLAVAAVIFGSAAWAAGSLWGRSAAFPRSPLMATGVEMLVGGAGLLVLATITGEWSGFAPAAVAPSSLVGFLYLIVVGGWIAFSCYVWLLRVAPTPLVATYAYINPVVALVLGYLIAGEALTARTILAAAIIIGSVVLTGLARRSAAPAQPAEAG